MKMIEDDLWGRSGSSATTIPHPERPQQPDLLPGQGKPGRPTEKRCSTAHGIGMLAFRACERLSMPE